MRTQDMTQGKPSGLIVSFALPLMAGSVFQQVYTLTDTAIVGNFVGVEALAALGSADWFNWMVLSLVLGVTQGFSILMSQRFGAGDWPGLRKVFAMSALLSAGVSLVVLALSQSLALPVFRLLRTPDNIVGNALLYVRIYFAGIPIVTAYNLLAGTLRALGDARSPLAAMVVSSLANIALDLLFVLGFGWGIAGAAAATLIAQALSLLYCLWVIRRVQALRPTREERKLDGPLCAELMRLGAPLALQNVVISFGGMAVQRVVNGFGVLFIAGYTATNKLYGILELAATSFGHALSVYTGQNLGAKRYDRIRAGMRSATWISLATAAAICALMLLLGRSILSLFISAPPAEFDQAMGYAYDFLTVMSLCLPVLYMLYVYRSTLQGMGNTLVPMASGFVELAMRVAAAILFSQWFGEYGPYLAEVSAWLGAAILLAIACYAALRKLPRGDAPEAEAAQTPTP